MKTQPSAKLFGFCLAAGLLLSAALAAQAPASTGQDSFREEQRITAADVVLAFAPRGRDTEPEDVLPEYLRPADFEVLYDGQPQAVVDVDAIAPAQDAPSGEPWAIVLYVDRRLAGPLEVSWAATELVGFAAQLTGLGSVEIVTADPFPLVTLPPTRDPELIQNVLTEMGLFPEGSEHELLKLRDEFLGELENPESTLDAVELASFATGEERRIVQHQEDVLLSYLADEVESQTPRPGPRRALFLVSAGFDLHPEEFYRPHLARHGKTLPPSSEAADFAADLDTLERALGSYGWAVFPLVRPTTAPMPTGPRIGKWQLGKPSTTYEDPPPSVVDPNATGRTLFNWLNAKRVSQQDPKEAESYLTLGDTLVASGDPEKAERAFRMALYHLADDPKTAARQAVALGKLSATLEQQGRRREAREAQKRAHDLDPSLTAVGTVPLGQLVEPTAPLAALAAATTGALASDDDSLGAAIASLARRVRLTYQVAGPPDGLLHPVEIRCLRKKCRFDAPAWARSGAPDPVAAARLRRWLTDDALEGALKVSAQLDPLPTLPAAPQNRRGRLSAILTLPADFPPAAGDRRAALRITLGYGDPDAVNTVEHRRHSAPESTTAGTKWTWATEVSLTGDQSGVAVMIEDLETGHWGAAWADLGGGDEGEEADEGEP